MTAHRIVAFPSSARQWGMAVFYSLCVFALWMLASQAFAADGTEFQAASDKIESSVKGYYGKLAALIAVALGALMAAIRKDWSWFGGAVILAIGVGIMTGIVSSSFTAII